MEEAETAFTRILGKRNGLGLINESVLVQEFLVGKEYVIDKVQNRESSCYLFPLLSFFLTLSFYFITVALSHFLSFSLSQIHTLYSPLIPSLIFSTALGLQGWGS